MCVVYPCVFDIINIVWVKLFEGKDEGGMMKGNKPALVIMAAGIGSRYGGGIKQLEPVGKQGEIIMDYSIHDAIQAGFGKIIFVIRRDLEADFRSVIGDRIEKVCKKVGVTCAYAYQQMEDLPEGFTVPEGRKKPWGTGQAVLSCKELLDEPFAVINADDYYGKEAFVQLCKFLKEDCVNHPDHFCMAGFVLKNTLSENGGVTRGICSVDANGYLLDVVETTGIEKTADGVVSHGVALDAESAVSMNMWGLTPAFMAMLEEGFQEFLTDESGDPLKKEFLLPIYIDQLLKQGRVSVRVLPTHDQWFGITFKEDKPSVTAAFEALYQKGEYCNSLFDDLYEGAE